MISKIDNECSIMLIVNNMRWQNKYVCGNIEWQNKQVEFMEWKEFYMLAWYILLNMKHCLNEYTNI